LLVNGPPCRSFDGLTCHRFSCRFLSFFTPDSFSYSLMKHVYAALAILVASQLATTAQAQNFRPFRTDLTYQFSEAATPGDTTHTLRLLGPGTRVGADSVFQFNRMAGAVSRAGNSCGATHLFRPDNLFGATLTVAANGAFVLTAANGRALTLRPRALLNQPWQALASGATATVQSRGVALVLGQPDSVVTIALSTGPTLRISKTFGLVEGPAVLALLNGRFRARQLTLTALPARGTGNSRMSPATIYDFQPGDVFLRRFTADFNASQCENSWQRDSVISRTPHAAGDSITYVIWTRRLTRGYGSPNAPAGYCRSPSGTFLSPPSTYTLGVSARMHLRLSALTNVFEPSNFAIAQNLTLAVARSTRYNRRYEQAVRNRTPCGPLTADSVGLRDVLDHGYITTYGQGLGLTNDYQFHYGDISVLELIGYRKGTETWGSLRTFAQLLAARPVQAASTTSASPNPFTDELTVTFELSQPQRVGLRVLNALGQVVAETAATPRPAGAQRLVLPATALVPGLYTVLLQPATGPAQVLKAVKAE
jgi:hypothetical protein